MPPSRIQGDLLRLLASHRDPESYVAASTPLNVNAPRFSGDIDVFHDREERVAQAAEQDAAFLQERGYVLQWLRRDPLIYTVLAARAGETTKLEWVVDSDFRFFPTVRDEMFGYVLHPVDLATNKVAAAYGRREPRDVVDLLTIHERILPLGGVVWASVGKTVGFTPEGVINEIRRTARCIRWLDRRECWPLSTWSPRKLSSAPSSATCRCESISNLRLSSGPADIARAIFV